MHLAPESFDKIAQGTKKIEIRLNDNKRQQIKIGDIIEFTSTQDKTNIVKATVKEINHYKTYQSIVESLPIELFDTTLTKDELLKKGSRYYSIEDQKKYGMVVFHIELHNGN